MKEKMNIRNYKNQSVSICGKNMFPYHANHEQIFLNVPNILNPKILNVLNSSFLMEIFGAINTATTLQSSSIWQKIISRKLVPLASPGLYICMQFRNIPESTDRSNRGQQLVEMTQIVCQLFLPILPVRYFTNNPVILYLQVTTYKLREPNAPNFVKLFFVKYY